MDTMPTKWSPEVEAAIRAVCESYERATDAEFILDHEAFAKSYAATAHAAARYLRPLLARLAEVEAERDAATERGDQYNREAEHWAGQVVDLEKAGAKLESDLAAALDLDDWEHPADLLAIVRALKLGDEEAAAAISARERLERAARAWREDHRFWLEVLEATEPQFRPDKVKNRIELGAAVDALGPDGEDTKELEGK